MNVFQDVHTYLIISFVLMIVLLFKKGYKKLDDGLAKNVNDIKDKMSNLETRKREMNEQLENLRKELDDANSNIDKAVTKAEDKAKKMIEKAGSEINDIVQKKQKEYENTIERIRSGLSIELQNKIINLVVKDLAKKLQDVESNREIQNIGIENSTKMLEELVEKYVK